MDGVSVLSDETLIEIEFNVCVDTEKVCVQSCSHTLECNRRNYMPWQLFFGWSRSHALVQMASSDIQGHIHLVPLHLLHSLNHSFAHIVNSIPVHLHHCRNRCLRHHSSTDGGVGQIDQAEPQ